MVGSSWTVAISTVALVLVTTYYAWQVKEQVRLQREALQETTRPMLVWDDAIDMHMRPEEVTCCSLRNVGRTLAVIKEAAFVPDHGVPRDCMEAEEIPPGLSVWAVSFPLRLQGTVVVHYRGPSGDYELKARAEDLRENLIERRGWAPTST